jgi:hypothetical protein
MVLVARGVVRRATGAGTGEAPRHSVLGGVCAWSVASFATEPEGCTLDCRQHNKRLCSS